MRTHHTAATLLAAALLALTGCADVAPAPAGTSNEGKNQPASAPAATRSVDPDAVRAVVGLPPAPKGAQRQAFLDGLDAIDTDIVHGKAEKAISRGIDTCGLIKNHPDQAKRAEQTNKRWTSPTHPDGHGLDTAAKILAVAHTTICPTY